MPEANTQTHDPITLWSQGCVAFLRGLCAAHLPAGRIRGVCKHEQRDRSRLEAQQPRAERRAVEEQPLDQCARPLLQLVVVGVEPHAENLRRGRRA